MMGCRVLKADEKSANRSPGDVFRPWFMDSIQYEELGIINSSHSAIHKLEMVQLCICGIDDTAVNHPLKGSS